MKRMRNPVIILAVLLLGASAAWAASSYTMQPGESLNVACQSGLSGTVGQQTAALVCATLVPTATATMIPPTHTHTPSPSPSATTPLALIEGVPICTDHDSTKWHPLVKKSGSTITCTYGHEHHDDPNTVNDLFGPPSAWYGGAQAISYPWQTSSSAGMENNVKHEGYKWYVARDQPCKPARAAPNDGCFRSWRMQVHQLGTAADVTVRFHSFSFEAVVEKDGKQGIVRHGGHIDTGHLALNVDGGGGTKICPPLASNPATFTCGSSTQRNHSSANVPPPYTAHNSYLATWYATHQVTSVGPKLEEWGPVDYQNPANQRLYPASLRANNSYGLIENMAVNVDYYKAFLRPFTDAANVIRFAGYTDQHGVHVPSSCTTPSSTCIPLVVDRAPVGQYIYIDANQGGPANPDHDVMSPITGNSLIRFPN